MLLDSSAAWVFVAKRVASSQPFIDLLEQYHVLAPFRRLFPGQYVFPAEWWDRYVGDSGLPSARRRFWIADPLLGHRLAPNAVVTENAWSYRATNDQGFIITDPHAPSYGRPKPRHVFRIVVFGGSTVEGDGATSSLAALPAQLQQALRATYVPAVSPRTTFEVINAGVGGYHSNTELLYYLSELHWLEPDLVVSYGGWNDLVYQNKFIEKYGPGAPRFVNEHSQGHKEIIAGYYAWDVTATHFLRRSGTAIVEVLRGVTLFDILGRIIEKIAGPTQSRPRAEPFFLIRVGRSVRCQHPDPDRRSRASRHARRVVPATARRPRRQTDGGVA
jgi:hypothetical protein